jgi:transposase-like protein
VWEERLHKLTDEDRERIIQFHLDDGMTGSEIARRFHVSAGTVSRILDGEREPPLIDNSKSVDFPARRQIRARRGAWRKEAILTIGEVR